jgi:AbrB family looped-hinge helix DNA binding protein
MNSILSEKGQVTIPKRLREDLGLVAGTVLDFSEDNGRLIIKRLGDEAPIRNWRGCGRLPQGRSVDAYLRAARDGR